MDDCCDGPRYVSVRECNRPTNNADDLGRGNERGWARSKIKTFRSLALSLSFSVFD